MPLMPAWVLLACATAMFAEGDYAGSRVCAPCHPAQAKAQSATGHARALHPAADHPLITNLPEQHVSYRPPDFRLTWNRTDNAVSISAESGQGSMTQPVQWAFGAGSQAITFVSQLDEDRYVEHHLSWYASTARLGLTPGHRPTAPASLQDALGIGYRTFAADAAILRCFRCHSTGPLKLVEARAVEPFEAGVRCEACHGPAKAHALRPARTNIYNPGKLDGTGMNKYCGNCHRPPASDTDEIDWHDPWNVRHQPLYLAQSKCSLGSAGKLRCVTCHDPHSALAVRATTYNARCLSCHTEPHSNGDCVACHMPRVKPHPSLTFTNHWIGVFGADKLQPR